MHLFIKFTENDIRLLIAVLAIFILVIILFGYLTLLVRKVMRWQGKRMDDLVFDVVKSGVINNEKKLRKFGFKKNRILLFKQARIPFIIMAVGGLALLIFCIITQTWGFNPFGLDETGFGTLFFVFDWEGAMGDFFGLRILVKWPDVIRPPYFSVMAIGSYIFVPCIVVGGTWFAVCVQAYIARSFRLYKKSKDLFIKTLDEFDPTKVKREIGEQEDPSKKASE